MGSDDELPFRVSGRSVTASRYWTISVFISTIGFLLAAASYLLVEGRLPLLTIAVSLILAGGAFGTGALRSLDNIYQEIRLNLPWIFVCALAYVSPFSSATDVLYGISAAYLVIALIELLIVKKRSVFISKLAFGALIYYARKAKSWLPKALSTGAVAASIRAFPLWLGILGLSGDDALSYAFAIGEVSFQIAMTYVNLLHSSRKYRQSNAMGFGLTILVFLVLASVLSVVIFGFLIYMQENRLSIDFQMLLYSSIYAVSIALFSLVRINIWQINSLGLQLKVMLVGQMTMFLFPAILLKIVGFNVIQVLIASVFNVIVILLMKKKISNSG